eukprot:6838456-Karenia_brevis.AAC.1
MRTLEWAQILMCTLVNPKRWRKIAMGIPGHSRRSSGTYNGVAATGIGDRACGGFCQKKAKT